MNVVHRHYRKAVIIALIVAAVCISIPVLMRTAMSPFVYASVDEVPQAQVAIVLGASVVGGKPSPILAARADMAIALYQKRKVSKILVTGDNAAVDYNEVNTVQKYLLAAGIPGKDIFLDHAGFDTYSSMYRAIEVFQAQSAIIVTQDFHLPRSLWIARHLGLTAYGVSAQGGTGESWDYIREIPASVKALFDVLTRREPKYLGEPYPLSGAGEATWY